MRDPYDVLGLGRNATEADVKAAFRRLAAQHHPDRNPGDEHAQARFTELNLAHQLLSDPQKRAAWDRYGEAAFRPGGSGTGGPDFVDLGSIDGLFGDLLGAIGIRTGDRGDLKKKLEISFEDAAAGCTRDVSYERQDTCESCRGAGGEPGSTAETCSACAGRGKVRFQQALLPVAVERSCSRCRGTGRIPKAPCKACGGGGLTKQAQTVEVTIPAGVEHGATRLVERAGHRLKPERAPGDLQLTIAVSAHPFFKRSGDDVLCSVPVTFAQAALGGEVEVPTLDGKAKVRVPPSTQPGSQLRLKGKGIVHRVRGGRGDQLVEITLEVPTELSPRAQELIAELGRELGEDVQPQQRSFVEKLKSLFG